MSATDLFAPPTAAGHSERALLAEHGVEVLHGAAIDDGALQEIAAETEVAPKALWGAAPQRLNRARDLLDESTAFDCFDRHHSLVLRYLPPEGWLEPLALPRTRSKRHEQARAQIAAIALDKAWNPQPWISCSRNKNHFQRRGSRYDERPDLYRYSIIVPVVDGLAEAGYLESIVAPPDPLCGWQSVFCATSALIEALSASPSPIAKPKAGALVQLRDEQKQLIDYRDTERTDRMRRRLVEINEAIDALRVELPAEAGERHGDLLWIGETCLNLGNTALYRVFNVDFGNGGRLYGHWTQSVPKELRAQLTINGEPVAEPDYPSHHLRILYALKGFPLTGDHYEIDGWERQLVKLAVLILINAPTLASAIWAIAHHGQISRREAAQLVEEIKRKHRAIESYFHSEAGRWLQRIDSDIAERVALQLIRRGIPVLPIHDSFIGAARHESAVRAQMDEAVEAVLATVLDRKRRASRITQPKQEVQPEKTYTMVSPSLPSVLSSVVPFPLSLRSGAFFDERRRLTKIGQRALLDAKRRRAIRQDELANLASVSRPALANILAGRFGTTEQVAERIARVVLTTPAHERQPFLPGLAA